jgi:hypothetical protein
MQTQRKFNQMPTQSTLVKSAQTMKTVPMKDTDWQPRIIAGGDWDTAGKSQMMNHTEAKLEFIHNAIDNDANTITISKKRKYKSGSTVTQMTLADIVPSHYQLTDAVKGEYLWEVTVENDGKGMTQDEMVENFGKQGNDKEAVRNNSTIGHYKRGSVMAMETLNWDCGKYPCVITSVKNNKQSILYVGSEGIKRGTVSPVSPYTKEGTSIYLPCVAESNNHYSFLQEISAKLYPVKQSNPNFRLVYKTDSGHEELEFSDPLYKHLKGLNPAIVHRSFIKGVEKQLKDLGVLSIESVSFYEQVGRLGYDFAYYDRQKTSATTGNVIDFRKAGYYITFVNDKGKEVTLACGFGDGGKFLSGQTDRAGLRVNIRMNKKAFNLFGISTNKSHVRIDWELMRNTAPLLFQQLESVNAFHTSGSTRTQAEQTSTQVNENAEIEKLLTKYLGYSIPRVKNALTTVVDETLKIDISGKLVARNLISQPNGAFYSLTKIGDCLVLNINTTTKHYDVYSKLNHSEKALMDCQYINMWSTCLHMVTYYSPEYSEEFFHEQLIQFQSELLRTIYKS